MTTDTQRRATRLLLVGGVLAVLIRAVVAVLVRGNSFDLGIFAAWAKVLGAHPLHDFYRVAGDTADHLPGDLYLHRVLVGVCSLLGIEPGTGAYQLALKGVGNLADVAAAALAWVLVRHHRPHDPMTAAVTAVSMLLTPSTIALAAAWGQWDMVSVALFLGGVLCLTLRRWWIAPALFGWACLIKPQLALAVVALLGVWLLTQPVHTAVRRAVVCMAIGVGTVLALCAPFSVGIPTLGAQWSLVERITYAGDLYPYTTLGAPNVWQLHTGPDTETVRGVTYRTVGHLLLLGCLGVLSARWWRLRPTTNWLGSGMWLVAMSMWAFYICETRCHERYLVPAAALLIVHAGLTGWRRRETVLALGLTAVLTTTLTIRVIKLLSATLYTVDRWVALVNVALFVVALACSRPWPVTQPDPDPVGEEDEAPGLAASGAVVG